MINITEKEEFKTLRVKKESWKYLKKKSTDKDTSILEEVDSLVQKEIEIERLGSLNSLEDVEKEGEIING